MSLLKTVPLFFVTACAEILGCYLPYLVFRRGKSIWFLFPAAISLALFVWLLSRQPGSAGRTYAAYGAVYVATAVFWLWVIERQRPDRWDLLGATISILGMGIILFGHRK